MDFESLLAQADSNTYKLNKKVREADREMEFEKRRNIERLMTKKKLEREEIKRKAPPKPEKPRFVIPKKNNDKPVVDKNGISNFLQRQEREKRQHFLKKQREKEELIRLRLEANGGKANKKISKHFGKSPIELQMRYAHNPEHEEILRRQQQREEDDHEKLCALYRQGVYKALNAKDMNGSKASIQRSSNKTENTNKKIGPSSLKPSSSHSRTALPIAKKRKLPTESIDFSSLMQKAEQNRSIDSNSVDYKDFSHPIEKQVRKPVENDTLLEKNKKSRQLNNYNNNNRMEPSTLSRPMKTSKPNLETPKAVPYSRQLEKGKITTYVDPEGGSRKEKRYLPGDIRYKGPPVEMEKGQSSSKETIVKERRVPPGDRNSTNTRNQMSKMKAPIQSNSRSLNNNSVSSSKQSLMSSSNSLRKNDRGSSSSSYNNDIERARSELERRRRELKLLEKKLEQKQMFEEKRKNEINLQKIKQEQQMRYEQNKKHKNSHYGHVGSSKDSRYANYSDTEEDEEVEDEEYDSDLVGFIDDTGVDDDDLQREDFEESLRMINRRYDKKKWKQREQMIDDRRMDSRFRDIEVEEHQSAKIGFYEDLREAKRGSKALG